MDIIRKEGIGEQGLEIGRRFFHSPFAVRYSPFAILLWLFALSLSACISTRPVVKIGLLAPFEGVYRQAGYDALTAMRTAIDEQNPAGVDVLPLALDTSRDVARTGQKALADPSVVAIVGPFWAAEASVLGGQLDRTKWFSPYNPVGDVTWRTEWMDRARLFADKEGRRLVLAGLPAGWLEAAEKIVTGPDGVQAGDLVLWLGDAAAGADFAAALWQRLPDAPFGLDAAGVETVLQRAGAQAKGQLFAIAWIDDGYSDWAASHSPNTPAAYTVYRLTANILHNLNGQTTATNWQPALFIVDAEGRLRLLSDR